MEVVVALVETLSVEVLGEELVVQEVLQRFLGVAMGLTGEKQED